MILLDTNLVSEPLRPAPEARVIDWMNAQLPETLYLSAISVAELRLGVALLTAGKRKQRLQEDLETRLLPVFSGRVLPFDFASSATYAELVTKAQRAGRALHGADAYIAAIAAAHGMAVATRDTAPFTSAGLRVINPWQA